jgi:hypothetical protein
MPTTYISPEYMSGILQTVTLTPAAGSNGSRGTQNHGLIITDSELVTQTFTSG